MRVNIYGPAVLLWSACAAAQLSQLPDCAQTCVRQFTSGSTIGGCSSIDAKCICSKPDFLTSITCCVANVCDASDQQKTIDFATSFCRISGVTNLPQTATCSSGASSATGAAGNGNSANQNSTVSSSTSTTAPSATSSKTGNAALGRHDEAALGVGVLGAAVAAAVALL